MPSIPTPHQGQFLAFIYYCTKNHKCPPAEDDIAPYFEASPPVVFDLEGYLSAIFK